MSPVVDLEKSFGVLGLQDATDVDELSVLENKEIMPLGGFIQAFDGGGAQVGDEVDVSFKYTDVWSEAYRSMICQT